MPTSRNCDSCVPKFVQSILELQATDEIHIEDRMMVWPELRPDLIRPMAYSCFEKGCPTKPYATMPKGNMGIKGLWSSIEALGVSAT